MAAVTVQVVQGALHGQANLRGGMSMHLIIRLGLTVSLTALLLSGCSTIRPHSTPPELITHRVMPGETLECIAKWYAGSESQWHEIVGYNPGINPRNLQVHDVIKIPTDMATTHTQQARFSLASRCTQVPTPAHTKLPEKMFGPK